MYDLSYLYRTVTNLPAPSWTVEEYDGDTEVTASTSSSTSEENCENRWKKRLLILRQPLWKTPTKQVRRNQKQEHRLKGRNWQIRS